MKKWHRYFLNIWTPVIIMAAVNICILVSHHIDLNPCGYQDAAVLSHKQGRFGVVLRWSFCDRGCAEKIVLRTGLFDTSIFVFEPLEGCPKPVVRWLNQDLLEIAMKEVSHIYIQRKNVLGIRINYKIGKVDDPYP